MKKYMLFMLAVSGFLLLSGCATNIVYDRSIPDDETCYIRIHRDLTVVKFNERNVRWKIRFLGYNLFKEENFAVVRIPIGEHKMILNYSSSGSDGMRNYTKTAKGLELNYDFKAGITYTLRPMIMGNMVGVMVVRF